MKAWTFGDVHLVFSTRSSTGEMVAVRNHARNDHSDETTLPYALNEAHPWPPQIRLDLSISEERPRGRAILLSQETDEQVRRVDLLMSEPT